MAKKLLVLPLVMLFFASCVTLGEERFFYPEKNSALPLKTYGNITTQGVSVTTDDRVVLEGIEIKYKDSRDYLLYFYGNMENIDKAQDRLYYLAESLGLNVICIDYRGYGKSGGAASFDNLGPDGLAVYDFVQKNRQTGVGSLFLFSQSLGTVPCTYVGARRQPDGIIMEAPFTSAGEAVPLMTEALAWPLNELIKLKADDKLINDPSQPIENIKKFTSPLLILHGTKDNCFPVRLGEKMYDNAGSKDKVFCRLEGVMHDNVDITKGRAREEMEAFVNRHRKSAAK